MDPKVISVGTFESPWEATTAQALLEVNGIPSVLVNAVAAQLFTPLTLAFLDPVEIEVPEEHRAEAERLIAKLRAARSTSRAGGASIAAPEICLQCGASMDLRDDHCSTCGWSWVGEETTLYENGPVPDSLLGYVHSPRDSRRFALPADAAKRYVHWCRGAGLAIQGWEVWQPEMATHRVMEIHERGDGEALLAAIPAAVAEHGEKALFCAYVSAAPAADERKSRESRESREAREAREEKPREAEME